MLRGSFRTRMYILCGSRTNDYIYTFAQDIDNNYISEYIMMVSQIDVRSKNIKETTFQTSWCFI